MKRAIYSKRLAAAIGMAALCCLPGCGSEGSPKLQVKIFDRYTETRLEAQAGITVGQALEEAEISVRKEDVVSPSLDARVTEDGMEVSIGRCAKVTIGEDGKGKELTLVGKTVGDAITAAKIEVGEHDEVSHDLGIYLVDGMDIQVLHRYAAKIDVDGRKVECLTEADTVKEMLEEQGIHLDEKDQVSPALETKIQEGIQVAIHRVFVEQVTEREPIPFDTETEYSSSMYQGEATRRQQGQEGEKELTYEVTYVDGQEEERVLIEEKVVKEPVNTIVVKGTKERRSIVSKEQVFDCDGSGHGYYIITWSDGVVEYQDF